MICPVCGNDTFDNKDFEYSICGECFWEYDLVQLNDPDFAGGANHHSLNGYRKIYQQLKNANPSFSCKNEADKKLIISFDKRPQMVFELDDTSKVSNLFDGWNETLIYSCIQKVMGKIFVTDIDNPKSAFAYVGCFGFFAGEPDKELVINKPDGFVIMIPQNEAWAKLIKECFPAAKQVTRYAIKKNTVFDEQLLRNNILMLPEGYELKKIDAEIYDKCFESSFTEDFVSSFANKEQFLKLGRGMVILKDEKIVAGASSYTRYLDGIEIEVDTIPDERRKHLATIACSALILNCLKEGLYPSWDAQNMNSVRLAQKLGYEYDNEYLAYEVTDDE